ncbi:YheC/YheD family protein [Paenibacillus ginsengarvi]|uniref:ATP-grasp domain-containing protein n=1 Tax=Paenibacillus ginsengarvi TaxID=400777 RepID=A0A3B0C1E2_9BACL|nr:YheC/YheD family protein [Paenibacillus ginsengarvi]RKN79162.1 hypothetical protein D7M11_21005 [Paenibacillus ginsengarvi]
MSYGHNKWTKYKLLRRSSRLASALPRTSRLTRRSLNSYLERFGKVIIKPSNSAGGSRVIQISPVGNGRYEVHDGKRTSTVKGRRAVYAYAQRKTKGGKPIVQRRIALARVNGKPFDVRVMVQKKRKSRWTVTGTLAKIAGPGYIITNTARSNGKVVPVSTAIRRSGLRPGSRIKGKLKSTAMKAVRQLHKYYPIDTVGMDMGVDTKGKVWIIEANFKPAKSLFRKLKDKSAYRRIMSYYRQR